MFQSNPKNLRSALLLGAATAAAFGLSAPARADDTTVETVVVTGSRIPQQGLYASSPVTAIGQQEIKLEGTTSVESLIDNLPVATADYNAVSSAFSGALGTANVDLRSLGSSRTLVLIDGKRLMPGDPLLPVADVNQIPASLVDHVEVLTGGASAVYGSDAVAGVVNFIMRKDFEGVEVDGQYGVNNAPNDASTHGIKLSTLDAAVGTPPAPQNWWGGETADATLLMGVNSPNGKGNVTAWLGYRNVQPVAGSERDFSNCTLGTDFVSHLNCQGSSNLNRWISFDNLFGGTPRSEWDLFQTGTGASGTGQFIPYHGLVSEKFNFGAPAYIQQPSTRYTGGFDAHYEVSKQLDVYSNFMFMDNFSSTDISPTAVFLGSGPANFPGTLSPGYVQVNCSNPLMTAQENQTLCGHANGFGNNGAGDPPTFVPDPNFPAGGYWNGSDNITPGMALLQIGRRNVEFGNRHNETRHDAFRMVVGAKGDLGDGWSYDLYGQYGLTLYNYELSNDWSKQRVEFALNVDPATGQCYAKEQNIDTQCVPLDIFNGIGSLTPAMSNYIQLKGFETGYTEEQVVSGSMAGDLGSWGGQLPWAKNPIGVAFGAEWRAEYLRFDVDHELSSNDGYGVGGAILAVPRSGFNVAEGFGEIRVPVVQDHPFFEDLTLNGGYRYSSYSSVGAVHSFKYGAEWQPIDDFRLRASFERATRAPNVLEVFTPNNVVLFSGQDPCATSNTGQCAGVPNAGSGLSGLLACPATQCNHQTGGNLSLKPEQSDTQTFGIVLTPTFITGFTATIDYFDIKVNDYVGTYGATTILNGCYGSNATAASIALYCPLVHRAGSGAIYGAGYVVDINHNLPFIKTKGADFEANYNTDLGDWGMTGDGSLAVNFIGTWTSQYAQSPSAVSNPASFDCAGLFGVTCGSPYPKWRHKMRFTWSSPWDVDFSVGWRHISSVALDYNSKQPLLSGYDPTAHPPIKTTCPGGNVIVGGPAIGAADCVDNTIPAFDYIDLSFNWAVRDGLEIRGGVNNVFAKEPPILDQGSLGATPIPFGAANTFPGTYDPLGRSFFIAATVKY